MAVDTALILTVVGFVIGFVGTGAYWIWAFIKHRPRPPLYGHGCAAWDCGRLDWPYTDVEEPRLKVD